MSGSCDNSSATDLSIVAVQPLIVCNNVCFNLNPFLIFNVFILSRILSTGESLKTIIYLSNAGNCALGLELF